MAKMYQQGHRGNDIKEMQGLLRDNGFYNYKHDTGYFGPQTEKALKEYQRTRGIKVDGIYGPRTQNMLQNEGHAQALLNSPSIKGTPHEAILRQMYGSGNHAINLGKGGMTITPEDVEQFHKNMNDELTPYYPQQQ